MMTTTMTATMTTIRTPTTTTNETVPHASHGLETILSYLLTQIGQVDIHHVGSAIEVDPPHRRQQLLAAENLPGIAHERLQEGKLPGRQIHRSFPHANPSALQVKDEGPPRQGQSPRNRRFLPKTQAHSGKEFLEGERLGHVVVRPTLQARDAVGHRGARREHDDRHLHPLSPDLFEDLEAVNVGQADI